VPLVAQQSLALFGVDPVGGVLGRAERLVRQRVDPHRAQHPGQVLAVRELARRAAAHEQHPAPHLGRLQRVRDGEAGVVGVQRLDPVVQADLEHDRMRVARSEDRHIGEAQDAPAQPGCPYHGLAFDLVSRVRVGGDQRIVDVPRRRAVQR
jgi:hypothetical protein